MVAFSRGERFFADFSMLWNGYHRKKSKTLGFGEVKIQSFVVLSVISYLQIRTGYAHVLVHRYSTSFIPRKEVACRVHYSVL